MAKPLTIAVKRIHEPAGPDDGARFLVDRLWPRGVSKEKAALAAWLKPLSPSDGLRKRFHGETADSDEAWDEFRRDYFAELDVGGEEVKAALFALDAAETVSGSESPRSTSTVASGKAAPIAKLAAEAAAACTGRAAIVSVIPSSSRKWVSSALCAVSSAATCSASVRLSPRSS